MTISKDFANYCCELLSSAGPCVAKRMFGGFGISTDGLTLAILADLGDGEKLWLKGDEATRSHYEFAGCTIFTYPMKGVPRSMNYFSAPEDAMDSADAMRPWAALALQCAVRAQAAKRKPAAKAAGKVEVKAATQTISKPVGKTQAAPSGLSHAVLERAREAAVKAATKKTDASTSLPIAKPSKPAVKRAAAPDPKTTAKRKSANGASTAAQ
jgi:DNA transformation protein and related proteins